MNTKPKNAILSKGFTLLEMMVVIMIIGILSASLIVMVPEMLDKANITANQKNMSNIYQFMLQYRDDHSMSWPKDNGQRFFLRLWKDRYLDHTEKNAKMFFNPKAGPGSDLIFMPEGMSIEDYLNDWDSIGPEYTSYAGFNDGGDRSLRKRLARDPGHTAIVSDSELWHRTSMVYLTGDGATHKLLFPELSEELGVELDELLMDGAVLPGPGCVAEILATVTND